MRDLTSGRKSSQGFLISVKKESRTYVPRTENLS